MNIINSQSLLHYNTFKVNVHAKFFTTINNEDDLFKLFECDKFHNNTKLILGGGSNILFTENFNGLVINNQIKGINIVREDTENIEIEIGAGEQWDQIVHWSTQNNYYGIENLSLIPGSVGAAPIQNIGAYGCELKDCFKSLEAINLITNQKLLFTKNDCEFGYRDSVFKKDLKNQFIITKVNLKLGKSKKLNLSYNELKDKVSNSGLQDLNSEDIRNIIIKIRNSKLPNPRKLGNAGSFFKNPIINKNQLELLKNQYPKIPVFNNKKIKIPAAWLIEQSNWRGYKNQTCGVYDKHSLIIINHNKATGKEIEKLSQKIKKDVYQKFNILLEEEVSII